MTVSEHIEKITRLLKNAERAVKKQDTAMRKLHAALQAGLEEHGPGCLGLTPGEITTYGGGTPKSQ